MRTYYRIGLLALALTSLFSSQAQKPNTYHPGEIRQMLKKLNVLGTVLYVAAHPDDENTRMIAYYANEEYMRTAYLSATRGDGGQNLIGPEIREGLGLIRTQELLAARRTDGGRQFFSRANDFGYSKHPDETLTIWEKDKVLSDFVRVIRQFKPDVMITRFNTNPGTTHGHHTTSAILAKEAFKLAGDPNAYPEQLNEVDVWQPQKLFWNTSTWFYRRTGQKFDPTGLLAVDVGAYNANLGLSYTEVASFSRSMHRSQGFGSTGTRGEEIEYLKQWDGDTTQTEVFGGIVTDWSRVENSDKVAKALADAEVTYDVEYPQETLNSLFEAREQLLMLPDQFWKEIKLKEINQAIRAITGTYLEVVADDYNYVRGDTMQLELEAISRVSSEFELVSLTLEPWNHSIEINQALDKNLKVVSDFTIQVPDEMPYSSPYWLNEKASLGMYHVEDTKNIGKPENDAPFNARFTLKARGQYFEVVQPISFKRNDPVMGETYRPIAVIPKAMVNLSSEVMVFAGDEAKTIEARVIAGKKNVTGQVRLNVSEGWTIKPDFYDFDLGIEGEEVLFSFEVIPPKKAQESELSAELTIGSDKHTQAIKIIDYDHIPTQTILSPSAARLIKLDLQKEGNLIGYIEGAGDAIPENLRQIGYEVELLEKDDVVGPNLMRFDAVILGVRAFNTVDWLAFKNQELFEYVKEGGTVIVQYNTSHRLVTQEIAPYPIKLSRDRVAVENAPIRVLAKDHEVMRSPNKIKSEDFDGWVQERGLYFPNSWDENFTPILSSNDPGEPARDGGLLVAQYGEGYYIYSGYSWFRELPAGVSGAYRIFTNLISIGKSEKAK